MKIFSVILFNLFLIKSYSLCLPCTSILFRSCYYCQNEFPIDRSHVEKVSIDCNSTQMIFHEYERFFSIIKSYSTRNCTMKIFYLDQFTLWNYLESMSITYAHLTHLSPVIFNRSLSFSPILYSIKTLNLSHNLIRLITKNFSYYFPSLEKLDLSYNHLILIRRKAFTNFIHLKELYLNNNHLKDISLTILPRQSLRLINLNSNRWYCSCTNVLTLSISRPIPSCRTPIQYKHQNAGDIARQCFLRTKAVILITTNLLTNVNLTCALSSTIDIWKNKSNSNITLLSAWHIEQHRPIAIEYLYTLSKRSEKYLICFNLNSSHSESIHTIIPLTLKSSAMNTTTTNRSVFIVEPVKKLSPFFLWFLNTSKILLPKYFQNSEKKILIIWLILLILALLLLVFLIYFIHRQQRKKGNYQVNSSHHQFIRFDKNSHDHHTIFNLKFNCKNHKCLCQYRRNAHSTMYLNKSKSVILSNLELNNPRPLFIQPAELRYAKIKRISSTKDLDHQYLAGQFRTIVKFKSLPN